MDVTIYQHTGDRILLEEVGPDYAASLIEVPPEPLYRIDDRGLRFYYSLDSDYQPTFYGSTTTIKSLVTPTPRAIIEKELEMGKDAFRTYRDMRASFGTFWHIEAARFTQFREYDLDKLQDRIDQWGKSDPPVDTSGWYTDAWKGLLSWMQFMSDYSVEPLAIEIPLPHPDGYAGTIDLVCRMYDKKYTSKTPEENRTRINAIIDWKSGYIFPDHAIQLHMNKRVWEHQFSGQPIQAVYNWTWRDWTSRPTYDLRNQTDSEEAALIDAYLHIWKTKFFSKPRDIRISGGVLKIGNDTDPHWSEVPIGEYVRQRHLHMDGVQPES